MDDSTKASRTYGDPCGVARSLDVIGERWALLVVRDLLLGPKRFNDLLAGLPAVSPNVLSQRLRELVDRGVVRRREIEPPARVIVYELTDWGRELEPIVLQLGRWGGHAPRPPGGELGLDSMLLSIKTALDPAPATALRQTYAIRVDGESFALEADGGGLDVRRGKVNEPDATITTDGETLRALIDGRDDLTDAIRSGNVHIDGTPQSKRHARQLLRAANPTEMRQGVTTTAT
jgi:DNA-binding HxlR family transcriptional regulator